jgi:hypothetical protein
MLEKSMSDFDDPPCFISKDLPTLMVNVKSSKYRKSLSYQVKRIQKSFGGKSIS